MYLIIRNTITFFDFTGALKKYKKSIPVVGFVTTLNDCHLKFFL